MVYGTANIDPDSGCLRITIINQMVDIKHKIQHPLIFVDHIEK
jgi:hypothetical protein